jgi:sugar phosphate isomerase/epimerase
MTRRSALAKATTAVGAAAALEAAPAAAREAEADAAEPFGYCFNTSTIRGQNLPLVEEIKIAAQAGYTAIEPWIREIDQYVAEGGSLDDLAKLVAEVGLTVAGAIGFAEWIVDDDARRAAGLDEARRSMELVAKIGGRALAAPPAGAVDQAGLDLSRAAERYRALLELGDQTGVVPQLELWGFSKTLSRLGEVAFVAVESGHPQASLLLDVYHLYKGGSDYSGVRLLSGAAMQVWHVNDYPAQPGRAEITDAHRVYPGDGVAPLAELFRDLRRVGYRGMLSVELFNADYYRQDPLRVARTALEKLKAAVRQSWSGGEAH